MVEKDIPTVPQSPSSNLDPLNTTMSTMQLCVTRLRAFFQKRPITTRRAVFNEFISVYGPGNADSPLENWRPILRFALPYVCYMFKSGPYRDAYVAHGLDPRKDAKYAPYQTAIFNFRTNMWRNKAQPQEEVQEMVHNRTSHIFTGKDVGTKVVAYAFIDITDPMLRKLIDEAPLREKFHVPLHF
jgi:general transcription factor 3C polypeptide 5 (transcription factor C subunit 1)